MSDRLSVTIVATAVAPIGGEELATFEVASRMLARGHELTVITSRCDLPPQPSLRVVRLPIPLRPRALTYPLYLMLGTLAVRRHKRGLVHLVGALVLNRADLVSVHFCHHAYHRSKSEPRSRRLTPLYRVNEALSAAVSLAAERWCYRASRTRRLVSVSKGGAAELREYFPSVDGNVTVIPSAVDVEEFAFDAGARDASRERIGISPDERVAIFVGGDWGRKGLRAAIEGVALAPHWHLLVVGSGDVDRYRAIAQARGAGARVHFCGHSADVRSLYSAADAFLLPTSYETFSLVTYEAAAVGLPLLVGPVSGVDEILVDGENGWFTGSDPRDIARRLDTLACDEERRRHMAEAARASRRLHRWSDVADAYERLYGELATG